MLNEVSLYCYFHVPHRFCLLYHSTWEPFYAVHLPKNLNVLSSTRDSKQDVTSRQLSFMERSANASMISPRLAGPCSA